MNLITRSKWGARPPRGTFQHVDWRRGGPLYVHHTAGPVDQTVKQIQAFHQDTRGWTDIGYHFLVRADGAIYEGRPFETWGAHSPNANQFPAVALIGTYSVAKPTEAMHRSVWEVADWVGASQLRGHRDAFATSCPGDAAYDMIVKGARPEADRDYYYEYPAGDLAWGPYKYKSVRDARYLTTKATHPKWALRKYSLPEED